ncbi:hypothetical protein E2320_005763, partial [Naja naja]
MTELPDELRCLSERRDGCRRNVENIIKAPEEICLIRLSGLGLAKQRKEMYESSNIATFHGLVNSSSYHTFLLDEERSRLYVGAKDHIFSFNLVNFKDFQMIAWPVSHSRRDECKWAGKDVLKECANFIKVLKTYNQTHLYVCGTGAFHPMCTYIELGGHPE